MLKFRFLLIVSTVVILGCIGRPQDQNIEDIVATIFTSPRTVENSSRRGGFGEIVTAEPDTGSASASPVLVENQGASCKCVEYYLCNPANDSVIGEVESFGTIDIGVDTNSPTSCEGVLDVCCGQRKIVEKPIPVRPVINKPNRANGCGVRNPQGIDFELIGNLNNEAGFGEFPWTVALITISDERYICSGSLIHPQVVLTANHCVRKLNVRNLKVRAGEWDTQTVKERLPYQERFVSNIISHPDYVIQTVANNYALVVLAEPVQLSDHINVVCLPPDQQYSSMSRSCYVSSWGKDIFGKEGKHSVIMKRVLLPIISNEQCQNSLRGTRLGSTFSLSPTFICAGGQKGTDTCEGDGGAPLVCPVGPDSDNRYSQSGIVAWGIGCNEARPAVYANVALARNWIDSHMKNLGFDTSTYTY